MTNMHAGHGSSRQICNLHCSMRTSFPRLLMCHCRSWLRCHCRCRTGMTASGMSRLGSQSGPSLHALWQGRLPWVSVQPSDLHEAQCCLVRHGEALATAVHIQKVLLLCTAATFQERTLHQACVMATITPKPLVAVGHTTQQRSQLRVSPNILSCIELKHSANTADLSRPALGPFCSCPAAPRLAFFGFPAFSASSRTFLLLALATSRQTAPRSSSSSTAPRRA